MAKIPDGIVPFSTPIPYSPQQGDAKKARDKARTGQIGASRFFTLLEEAAEPMEAPQEYVPSDEAIQELLDAVHSSGDDLKKKPFPEEIKRYKRAVRNFLHYVVENSYGVEKQIGIPNSLKPGFTGPRGSPRALERKSYMMIQVVDQKLERLAAGILAGQVTQLEILAKVDEITGILVNLLR
ncbi:MAG: DUF327 family protein [Spirochaetaceae bacterium]|jgi:uncharacterized protein YaaR (DUF327 family)|nr:DUF327 family protein [Spirochaetaceae bacterium]